MLHDPNETLLFPKLSEQELQGLSEHGREVQLAAGDVLFRVATSNGTKNRNKEFTPCIYKAKAIHYVYT